MTKSALQAALRGCATAHVGLCRLLAQPTPLVLFKYCEWHTKHCHDNTSLKWYFMAPSATPACLRWCVIELCIVRSSSAHHGMKSNYMHVVVQSVPLAASHPGGHALRPLGLSSSGSVTPSLAGTSSSAALAGMSSSAALAGSPPCGADGAAAVAGSSGTWPPSNVLSNLVLYLKPVVVCLCFSSLSYRRAKLGVSTMIMLHQYALPTTKSWTARYCTAQPHL